MIPSATNLDFFFTGLQTTFWNAYGTSLTWMEKIASIIPSATEQQGYAWIGQLDKMREWIGPRTVHHPMPQTYFVTNKLFELTESIDAIRLHNDTYGVYTPVVQMMGQSVKKTPDYQLRDLINSAGSYNNATLQAGLDKLAHWSAVHPVDLYDSSKGVYVNDFGASGTSIGGVTVGGALAPNAFATLYQEFMSRKGESGEALGVVPNLTVVPPQLDIVAKTILHAQFFAPQSFAGTPGTNVGATENMLKGSTDLLMVPDFAAYPATWYMLDTSRPVKPFIWQQNMAPDFVYRINPDDPVVFDTHGYLYGSRCYAAPGWSLAWLSARSGV